MQSLKDVNRGLRSSISRDVSNVSNFGADSQLLPYRSRSRSRSPPDFLRTPPESFGRPASDVGSSNLNTSFDIAFRDIPSLGDGSPGGTLSPTRSFGQERSVSFNFARCDTYHDDDNTDDSTPLSSRKALLVEKSLQSLNKYRDKAPRTLAPSTVDIQFSTSINLSPTADLPLYKADTQLMDEMLHDYINAIAEAKEAGDGQAQVPLAFRFDKKGGGKLWR